MIIASDVTRSSNTVTYVGRGITSQKDVKVNVSIAPEGSGVVFNVPDRANESNLLPLPATTASVVNTLRNVTLGTGSSRLAIVEHFLAAAGLFGLNDLNVEIHGMEFPLGDGSAKFWLDLFERAGWGKQPVQADLELKDTIVVKRGDRLLMAVPDDKFSINYMIDWDHPLIGRQWRAWSPAEDIRQIADARTFGSRKEHDMLGITGQVVSMTPDGFDEPLRWADEPVRHKLLDLFGDLFLAGVNPMRWKARFISIKGGHEMDVEMAKNLRTLLPV
jgi:UDP-3-O-[3-hydroxymyristoyl] N-acetylglucosamine deacetylase